MIMLYQSLKGLSFLYNFKPITTSSRLSFEGERLHCFGVGIVIWSCLPFHTGQKLVIIETMKCIVEGGTTIK